ncbi:putative DNA-directed RNA polymerase specialized sigma subunit, sigma24 [Acidobacteriia bacterium SbA2]|nr:putative DNA-directed RNA polymerase specialized sigma subunit, sigma24 [Acidobacteriia bacterium SbA2]
MTRKSPISRNTRKPEVGSADFEKAFFDQHIVKLVRLAAARMQKLRGVRPAALDPEIAAQSALRTVLRRINDGSIRTGQSVSGLWGLLCYKLNEKIIDQLRVAVAKKRGGGKVIDATARPGRDSIDDEKDVALDVFEVIENDEPTPEEAVIVSDLFTRAMAILPGDDYREIALLRLSGCSDTEIAEKTKRSLRGVQRNLEAIHRRWRGLA